MGALIDRAFLRVAGSLVHYRTAGLPGSPRTPLVMAHGGPGSSLGLLPLIADLAADRMVVAPDMMGNGESDPPPLRPTSIAFYADCLAAVMDHLSLPVVDLYGHHTGAQVVCELEIARPDRVRRVILDGVGLFSDDERVEFLERYAPDIAPHADGRHLTWVWDFISQTTQHFPHYRRDAAHRIEGGAVLPPAANTQRAAEVLKNWSTYHLSYQAAFAHRFAERLPLLTAPTWIFEVTGDPLARYAAKAAALVKGARVIATDYAQRPRTLRACLD